MLPMLSFVVQGFVARAVPLTALFRGAIEARRANCQLRFREEDAWPLSNSNLGNVPVWFF
jgi:hypothetical protein